MDRPIFKSLCGFSLASTCTIIGIIQFIIFGGIFFWEYAIMMVHYMHRGVPLHIFFQEMTLREMTNGAALISCIFCITMVVGVRKSQPGFILGWLVFQLVLIASSLLTLLYFQVASYLRLPAMDALLELCLNGTEMFCFLVVYSHYIRLRSGNLIEEPIYVE